jgi:hypothetical protein
MKILELFSEKKIWFGPKGYPVFWLNGKNKLVHEYIWEQTYGKKPKGSVIHHKDLDKSNYDIKNLQLCKDESEHRRIHAGWIKNDDGEWIAKPCTKCNQIFSLDEFYQRKGYTPSALCKKCSIRQTNTYAKNNPKTREYKRQWYLKNKKN